MDPIIPYCPLPSELVIEILLRLPVKSLLRFKTVCKQWCDIITSSTFIRNHLHHERNQVQLLANWSGNCSVEGLYELRVDGFLRLTGENLERYEEPDYLQPPGHVDLAIGPCNGIFCIANTCYTLALWNPSTRKMRPLPAPERFNKSDEIGFGVDPLNNEVKIVLIHTFSHPCFSIYTLSNDTWRYSENALLVDSLFSIDECGTTFCKGVFYWRKYNMNTSTSSILAFDMHNEVFQEMQFPNAISEEIFQEIIFSEDGNLLYQNFTAQRRAALDVFEDSLAMFCYNYDVTVGVGNDVDVWVMNEQGCWTKRFSLRLPFSLCRPLGFWTRKTFIYSKRDEAGDGEEIVLYDPSSGTTKVVSVPSQNCARRIKFWVFKYKETLFPLMLKSEIKDYQIQSVVCRGFFAQQ